MFEAELDNLIQKKWSEEERAMITRLMENVTYYKKLIPKSLKQDIMNALQMCNVLKDELEYYREICKCKGIDVCCGETCNCEDNCKCDGKCMCKHFNQEYSKSDDKKCKCEKCDCETCKCEDSKCV
jgi:hypothetical protein